MNNEKLRDYVIKKMYGWWGGTGHCAFVLGDIIDNYCCGNHLEIGTLFGASAIYAALVLERHDNYHKIYTIDPCLYETHEYCSKMAGNLSPDIVKFQPEIIQENIKKFKLEDRIVFIQKSSNPIPEELYEIEFSTCFIDGYHYDGMPLIDVKNCIELFDVEHLILDDTHYRYPEVMKAMKYLVGLNGWGISVSFSGTSAFYKIKNKEPNMDISVSPIMDKAKLNWPVFMEEKVFA